MTKTDNTHQPTAHTPEPWRYVDQTTPMDAEIGIRNFYIERTDGKLDIAVTCNEANARRIVAAVNACKGISTESLEQNAVQALLKAAEAAWRRSSNHEKLTFEECNQLCAAIAAATGSSMTTRNDNRAARAQAALQSYVETKGEVVENSSSEIADLIADLLHLTVRFDQGDDPVESILRLARMHFDAEHNNPEE
jgi:hypothetical protein